MLFLGSWILYGLVVGLIAKWLYPGGDEEPQGILATIALGIAGSYVGGFINFLFGRSDAFSLSGILMGIIGGVVCCWIYQSFKLRRIMQMKRMQMNELRHEVRTLKRSLR